MLWDKPIFRLFRLPRPCSPPLRTLLYIIFLKGHIIMIICGAGEILFYIQEMRVHIVIIRNSRDCGLYSRRARFAILAVCRFRGVVSLIVSLSAREREAIYSLAPSSLRQRERVHLLVGGYILYICTNASLLHSQLFEKNKKNNKINKGRNSQFSSKIDFFSFYMK